MHNEVYPLHILWRDNYDRSFIVLWSDNTWDEFNPKRKTSNIPYYALKPELNINYIKRHKLNKEESIEYITKQIDNIHNKYHHA